MITHNYWLGFVVVTNLLDLKLYSPWPLFSLTLHYRIIPTLLFAPIHHPVVLQHLFAAALETCFHSVGYSLWKCVHLVYSVRCTSCTVKILNTTEPRIIEIV